MTPHFSCNPSASQHTLALLTCEAQVSQILPLLRAIMEYYLGKENQQGEETKSFSFIAAGISASS